MILSDKPIGMIRRDELLNILLALDATDCDRRTLAIVAQATGLGEWFAPEQQATQLPVIFVDRPRLGE